MTRVFLADDHPMIQNALESLLRGGGRELVGVSTSGADAIEQIECSDADVIILDLQMPGGSGLQVLRQMRGRGDRRPVIFLAAAIGEEAFREGLEFGVDGVLLKSSDPALLLDCIDAVASGDTWVDAALEANVAVASKRGGSRKRLSDRERQLMQLVREGLRNREIAERLNTTEGTVKGYLHALYEKMQVASRTELAMKAAQIIGP